MRSRRWSLAAQFLVWQLLALLLVLGVVAAITVQQSTEDFRSSRQTRLLAVAESLAATPVVRSELVEGGNRRALEGQIGRAASLSGARRVQLVGLDGTVAASTDASETGTRATLGAPVAEGRSWSGDLSIDGEETVGGQAPVIGDDEEVLGTALVVEDYPPWSDRLLEAAPDLLLFLGAAAALGAAGAFGLSRLIRRQTRGLEPADIARLADHQEALLTGIHEGVVGVNGVGVITLVNTSAQELLGLDEGDVGRSVTDLDVHHGVAAFLAEAGDSDPTLIVVEDRTLVLTRRRTFFDGRAVGTVTTMVDRSDLLALQSQVSAQASITDALRAQTHEFDNRLHTISGLVQLEEYEEVVALIADVNRRRTEISDAVTRYVEDPRVAALLIAKVTAASEVGIDLSIEPESSLPRLDPAAAADVITVMGNLIDNALDATRANGGHESSVRLTVEPGGAPRIRVADTGAGIAPEDIDRVFERGWSTKPTGAAGRGIGLALVQAVCSRGGGRVTVMQGDHGAVFTATLGGVELQTTRRGEVPDECDR
ncbi:sensor histidine kinase [Janibacter sp. Soil728]|uniref:sensor histidine kinase n=1 Tax=Janibacter sp. Soil728 TaxID=1736393 RepID=UPI000B0F0ECA|nr:ATP-binding protein [Janibacter sp. Soil728]